MKIAACMIPLHDRAGAVVASALVSHEDAHLASFRWSISKGYAIRRKNGRLVKLHREILGLAVGDPRVGDHINGDTLDNRRANLRVADRATHMQNICSNKSSTSHFRGVSLERRTGKWVAQARVAGKNIWLGRFAIEEDAARVAADFRAKNMPLAVAR